jgi:hypothetical protein
MSNELEKDLNDEVYEDSFYDNEEELGDEEEKVVEVQHDDDDAVDDSESRIAVSFACEDCDYRWDDVIMKSKDNLDDDDDITATCPMCGSMNVSQI